jgi:hypothetical protein
MAALNKHCKEKEHFLRCGLCSKSKPYGSGVELEAHVALHHPPQGHLCVLCPVHMRKDFGTLLRLRNHEKLHQSDLVMQPPQPGFVLRAPPLAMQVEYHTIVSERRLDEVAVRRPTTIPHSISSLFLSFPFRS